MSNSQIVKESYRLHQALSELMHFVPLILRNKTVVDCE